MADVATVGLLQERAIAAQELLAEQLQTALSSRVLLEQAKGMLAERTGLPMDQAFQLMRGYARGHSRPLREIAERIIDGTIDDDLLGPAGDRKP
jgi:AmiR/NasT family two-component response regulator